MVDVLDAEHRPWLPGHGVSVLIADTALLTSGAYPGELISDGGFSAATTSTARPLHSFNKTLPRHSLAQFSRSSTIPNLSG